MKHIGSICQSKGLDTFVKDRKIYEAFNTYFTNIAESLNLGVAEKDQ